MERPNFDRWHPNADENRNACECADEGDFAKACAWLDDARHGLEHPELADDHAAAVAYVKHKAAEAGVPEAAAVAANLAGAPPWQLLENENPNKERHGDQGGTNTPPPPATGEQTRTQTGETNVKSKGELLADRLNAEGELPCDDNLAEHPEGADRGGYVETFTDDAGGTAYWYTDEWLAYN